jgi:hypothetical protein
MKTLNEKLDAISNVKDCTVVGLYTAKSSFFVSDGLDLEEFLQTPLSVEAALRARLVFSYVVPMLGGRILPSHSA